MHPIHQKSPIPELVLIAVLCAAGGLLRYGVSNFVKSVAGNNLPWGTFAVNVAGSFLIGLVMELGTKTTLISDDLRTGLVAGFLGGMTTFSAFSYETIVMLRDGQIITPIGYIFSSVTICLLFCWFGMAVVRYFC